jgi:hypothetical protein
MSVETVELPPYRAVLVVDTKEFGSNSDAGQEVLAQAIPEVVALAFERAGLTHVWEGALFPHNTGDGFGIGFDTRYLPAVVTRFFDELEKVLAERDGRLRSYGRRIRLRMRASLNVGPVRDSERPGEVAVVGNTVIATHRLLDAAPVREILTRSDPDQTFLSVALSQRVFEDVLASEYAVLHPSKVVPRRVQVKEFAGTVYLYVPNPSGDLLRDGFGEGDSDSAGEQYQEALEQAKPQPKPVPTTVNKNTIRGGNHHGTTIQVGQLRGGIHEDK